MHLVDYKIWSLVQDACISNPSATSTNCMNALLHAAWEAVDQRIIDAGIRQWQERLLACVKAKEGHFEHLLKLNLGS